MGVFLILLEILKFIVFFLAFILISILMGILAVMFVPFKWTANASKYDDSNASFRCLWLFGILKFEYLNSSIRLSIFGINILNVINALILIKKKLETNKSNESSKADASEPEIEHDELDVDPIEHDDIEPEIEFESHTESKKSKKTGNKKVSKINGFLHKIEEINVKFKYYRDQIPVKELISCTIVFFKKILKVISPKVCRVNLEIGLSEPHTTGYVLGILGVLSDYIPMDLRTTGVFDKEVIQGDIHASGKLYLYKIMLPSVKYVLSKPVLKVIRLALIEMKKQKEPILKDKKGM